MAALLALSVLLLAPAALAKKAAPSFVPNNIAASSSIEFTLRTSVGAMVNGNSQLFVYRPVFQSGLTYPGFDGQPWQAGTVLYNDGTPIPETIYNYSTARDFDKSSIFEKFGKIWMITQNEDAFGNFFLFQLTQDSYSGVLEIAKAKTLNIGAKYGTIRPCSGSVTPWKSHLAGEEDVVDARTHPTTFFAQLSAQAVVNKLANWSDVNPYWYGWADEITVTSGAGDYSINKRYALGRAPWETCIVLGDMKTVMCTADNSNGGVITLFVADNKKDLSSGRLYSSLPTQLNAADGGSFSIEWIPLNNGQSVNEAIVAAAIGGGSYGAAPVKFADLFDYMAPVMKLANVSGILSTVPDLTQKPDDFKEVKVGGTRYEWLRLKPGMQALASLMETERMSSYMGASNEWTKCEGATYDDLANEVYFAITSIKTSMLDNPGATGNSTSSRNDLGGPNAIRVPQNQPGAVYRMTLGAVAGISKFAPISARAVINAWGAPTAGSANFTVPAGSIASPDNVSIMPKYRTLIIAEDCDVQHPNNFLWAYNLDSGDLRRIGSTPYDAEWTSSYYYKNIGKYSYLTATVQHPRVQDIRATVGYWVLPKEAAAKRGRSMLSGLGL